MCVCLCVWVRERERWGDREGDREDREGRWSSRERNGAVGTGIESKGEKFSSFYLDVCRFSDMLPLSDCDIDINEFLRSAVECEKTLGEYFQFSMAADRWQC